MFNAKFPIYKITSIHSTVFKNKNDPDLLELKKEQLDEQLVTFKKYFTKSFDKIA